MASFSWGDLQQAADDAGFGVIPAGEYEAVVKSAEHKKTGTGKDKIAVRFSVTSGPASGKSVFNDFVISPDNGTALGFFFRHMKALGLGPDYFATNPDLGKVAGDLVGRNCVVVVGIRQWNEEDRNEVKGIKASGAAPAPLTAASAGPQPMTAQPMPQPQPMPNPVAQPQPAAAPVDTTTKKDKKEPEEVKAEPVDEAPAEETKPDEAAPAADEPTDAPPKPKLPF